MKELELLKTAWESAFNSGTRNDRIIRSRRVSEYFNYLARILEPDKIPDKADAFAEKLLRECALDYESNVLDIGCGTGGATLTFAGKCGTVTALDMCADALSVAQRRAANLGRLNIRFMPCLWEEFDTQNKYDLCYSAMCTGICNLEELLRFESYSKKSCALVTIGKDSGSPERRGLREAVTPEPLPGLLAEGILLFDLLYALGRRPNVVQSRSNYVSKLTVEEALRRFSIYYGAYGYNDDNSLGKLREHILNNSQNGLWIEHNDVTTMLIYWDVPE